jgi:hypothetical protein
MGSSPRQPTTKTVPSIDKLKIVFMNLYQQPMRQEMLSGRQQHQIAFIVRTSDASWNDVMLLEIFFTRFFSVGTFGLGYQSVVDAFMIHDDYTCIIMQYKLSHQALI